MPSEHVCTENLTPFLKLLPCKSFSGIASLLNPHRIFDADWHGLGIHVLWLGESGIKVRLSFQSVMDPLRASDSQKRGGFSTTLHEFIAYGSQIGLCNRYLATPSRELVQQQTPVVFT